MLRTPSAVVLVALLAGTAPAQAPAVTTPKAAFGFHVGDDYCLANYAQLKTYWEKLAAESDRVKLVTIGTTAEGRPQLAAVVTSPANHRRLAELKATARRLALADGIDAAGAKQLAAQGKAVVWIDGGLHASETLCAQVLVETLYQFASAADAETLRILDDVVILFVHANPDGHDLVADHYMKEKEPTKRSLTGLPRLYQKYVGHDNNRDFYANTQAETKNLNRLMYREWFPQIVYNHHQSGPPGTVLFCPPFRDPFNYFCDPLTLNGIDAVGAAMMQRFLVEGKPGATTRSGAPYSTWFNGGLRTTAGFHNMIGLLTETVGSPTPSAIPLLSAKQLPKGDYLAPVPPQKWRFRQSVDYSVTANRAVLDYASRHREQLLFNIWKMGNTAIERGGRDSWTVTPKVVEAAQAAGKGKGGADFDKLFRDPAKRDPRGYVLPADQPDFLTATKFVNALLGTGVTVHRATADFTAGGKSYPKGSYVVKTGQAFRAHVLDMFEPQDHPNDFAYPGGPPVRPYDSAGYTLAYQMAVKFDRLLDGFDGPFEAITTETVAPPPGRVLGADGAVGFVLGVETNDAFRAVNRLHKAGEEVRRVQTAGGGHAAGTFFVPRKDTTPEVVKTIAADLGVTFRGVKDAPEAAALKPARVALWDKFGGSMPSGWTRWLLEQFEFPHRVVFTAELDKGDLRERYDVLILVDGAYSGDAGGKGGDNPETPEAKGPRGAVSKATTLPQIKRFLEAGGTVLTIGSSTKLGAELGVPVANYLTEVDDKNEPKALASTKFYVPSSVLRVQVDDSSSLAWGLGDHADVMFSNSPTFRLTNNAAEAGVKRVAWFDSATPLRSGWAWGQQHLEGGAAVVDAKVGRGRLALYGPQVLFRGQPHGTFRLVFNGIVQSVVPRE
ncbi:M14 family metallopeptidase [Urbifossiella limnaea]|uniref:Zinc carboxypeptidase n=1 Tax=Urbifossiella limnaea TaxID=2528023 RepID=A0A517Y150_9BACT|nr:M14 metallopeptidase family protein [Urbifossiella limnaea]QDU23487.1 Zinc carboxypeptidase [Urbifossiella limnaea]